LAAFSADFSSANGITLVFGKRISGNRTRLCDIEVWKVQEGDVTGGLVILEA
jgi:hypothetical protein